MTKFKQNIETVRVISALEKLIEQGVIKNWSELARKYDYHPQKFTEVKGGRQNLPSKLIRDICTDYDINLSEIFGYTSTEKSTFTQSTDKTNYLNEPYVAIQPNASNTILHVPVEAEAGFVGGDTSPVYNQDLKPWVMPGFDEPGYSFRVRGDSMFPTFKDGEIVVTGTKIESFELIKREYVYVVLTADNILIKRVVIDKKRPGFIFLVSDNDKYERIEMRFDAVKLYRGRRNVSWDLSKKYEQ